MKLFLHLMILVSVSGISFAAEKISSSLSNILYQGNSGGEWVISIEDLKISTEELDAAFTLYTEQLDASNLDAAAQKRLKKAFLETFVQQNIIVKKAFEDKIFDDPRIQTQIKILMMQSIYQIYMNHILKTTEPDIEPTSEEINQFYEANKQEFLSYGMTAVQIQQSISAELSKQKLSQWMSDVVNKTRETYRIKRNETVLKKMGYQE